MRALLILICAATLAFTLPALAEVQPERTKPSWLERKVSELRNQRDWLRVENRGLRRTLLHRPSSLEALRLASIVYHVPFSTLYRRASCESTGSSPAQPPSERTLDAHADNANSSASGLLQFLFPSTWRSTPFARESVWSPYANALAAAWMMGPAGRGGEWVCQ